MQSPSQALQGMKKVPIGCRPMRVPSERLEVASGGISPSFPAHSKRQGGAQAGLGRQEVQAAGCERPALVVSSGPFTAAQRPCRQHVSCQRAGPSHRPSPGCSPCHDPNAPRAVPRYCSTASLSRTGPVASMTLAPALDSARARPAAQRGQQSKHLSQGRLVLAHIAPLGQQLSTPTDTHCVHAVHARRPCPP